MGLKIRLEWYDKETELGEGEDLSQDFGDDASVIEAFGMPIENNINNGGFDVGPHWVNSFNPISSMSFACLPMTIKWRLSIGTNGKSG
jgi:hypothetical protein